ncbi:histidine kinase [Thermosipho affectus]|uniref:Histidine kinase n=1 Tax=Thermosipho affectus TaxID=660294 RepID=A0ABX3IJ17_9BACT|nr:MULTISPECIES: SoxR reducing system RseC family protein [Thermosipho]ANQ53362.1 histidine kinase [Thermosipho sp. 1070]APT71812.1 histidine kinase [Thermosipho sp. 1063]ONN27826.1 histidine kinase [Thermosipho affectus]OOC45317.1 histidine kinase [Thermosipho sp. 1074]
MKELFRISKIEGKYIYLDRDVSACGACALSGSCNVKSVSTLKVEKDEKFDYFPGDFVILDLKYKPTFLAFMLYGLPVILLILGVGLGAFLKLSDLFSFFIGIGFMGIAFLINKILDKRFKPVILDVRHIKGG